MLIIRSKRRFRSCVFFIDVEHINYHSVTIVTVILLDGRSAISHGYRR